MSSTVELKPTVRDNTIVIEVDNLLIGWPTYTIDFTPAHPGPLVSTREDIGLEVYLHHYYRNLSYA